MAKFDPQKEVETLCKDYQWRLLKGKDNPFTGFDATIDTGLTFIHGDTILIPMTLKRSTTRQRSSPKLPK